MKMNKKNHQANKKKKDYKYTLQCTNFRWSRHIDGRCYKFHGQAQIGGQAHERTQMDQPIPHNCFATFISINYNFLCKKYPI